MSNIKKMVISALFVAFGIVLPIMFHSVPNAGNVFLPMHIPVLMCGIICGFPYGLACGVLAPLLSSLMTGMPPTVFLPSMLCELAAFGTIASLLMHFIRMKNTYAKVYLTLIGAMLTGRIVFGILNSLIFMAGSYSMQIWVTAAFITALPGIAIQILLIPAVVFALQKANLIELKGQESC